MCVCARARVCVYMCIYMYVCVHTIIDSAIGPTDMLFQRMMLFFW